YRRLLPRLGHGKAIWALAHRLCRLTWKILHQGVEYKELDQQMNPKLIRQRTNKLTRQLRALGYDVQLTALSPNVQAEQRSGFRPCAIGNRAWVGGFDNPPQVANPAP